MRLFEIDGAGVARDIEVIFQVLDAVVPDGEGSYLAAPISTGKRFFETMAANQVTSFSGLVATIGKDEYLRLVRWPNVQDGETVANRIRQRGTAHLINTGPIFIKEWSDRDYMTLCLDLIARKVKQVYFHPEWAFSAGAVEELVFCAQRGLTLLTSEGDPLTLAEAQESLAAVRDYLKEISYSVALIEDQMAQVGRLITQSGKGGGREVASFASK